MSLDTTTKPKRTRHQTGTGFGRMVGHLELAKDMGISSQVFRRRVRSEPPTIPPPQKILGTTWLYDVAKFKAWVEAGTWPT